MDERLRPLSLAFWLAVMEDLLGGDLMARLWLDTGEEPTGFLWWCVVTEKDSKAWRAALLRLWKLRGTASGKRKLKKLKEAMK